MANTAIRRAVVKLLKAWIRAEKESAQIAAAELKTAKPKKVKSVKAVTLTVTTDDCEPENFWEVVLA
jgi:hypothetical protein